MPLSPPAARTRRHKRVLHMEGFARDDGLWDIEGRLIDTKDYDFDNAWRGKVTAGTHVHEMWVRLTVDKELTVRGVETSIDAGPHRSCGDIAPAYEVLVGERIKPGWNMRIRELLGGPRGCVHATEMLGPLGTVAYQTIGPTRAANAQEAAADDPEARKRRPARLDSCHVMASDGPVAKERWPEFYTGK